jgi:hypothetical protein
VLFKLSVANKPFMLSVIKLNVVMLNVIMLNVVAPSREIINILKNVWKIRIIKIFLE